MAKESNIFLIERPEKLGLGSAYRTGFEWAINNNFENIIEMDADFSHSLSATSKAMSVERFGSLCLLKILDKELSLIPIEKLNE